ncbi:uncharacterized protein LOC141586391 [Silene latifolia]|uniref:uncharacterized protein LOC141586391 n=1 Tax=Silene latifolia TaxID=37657 RepID=UPI003D76B7F2
MAAEICMQLSTSASMRVIAQNSHTQSLPKSNLSTIRGFTRSFPMLSSTPSFVSSPRRSRNSGIICKASEAVQVINVTDSSWKELVLESPVPVLVDFWAPWCGPCKLIAPLVDELAKDYAGKIRVYKLDTDVSPKVATEYGIKSIPTILFFKNGERIDCVIGAVSKTVLSEKIDKYLSA